MIIAVIAVISEAQRIQRSKKMPLSAKIREDNRFFRCFLAVIGKKYYICSRNTNINLPIIYGLYISESVCAEVWGILMDTCLTAQDFYKRLLDYFQIKYQD